MRKYFSMIERGKPSEAFAKTWRLRSKKNLTAFQGNPDVWSIH